MYLFILISFIYILTCNETLIINLLEYGFNSTKKFIFKVSAFNTKLVNESHETGVHRRANYRPEFLNFYWRI